MRAGQGSRSTAQNTQLPFGYPNNVPAPGFGFGGQTLGQGNNGGFNQSVKLGGGNFGGAGFNNNNGFFK